MQAERGAAEEQLPGDDLKNTSREKTTDGKRFWMQVFRILRMGVHSPATSKARGAVLIRPSV